MRVLDRELKRAADGLMEASRRIPDRPLIVPPKRRRAGVLTPIVAAAVVLTVIGVPAWFLDRSAPAANGETGGESPSGPNIHFSPDMNGWTLVAVIQLEESPDLGVYRGPMPDADGKVLEVVGDGFYYWPPRDRSGNPLLLFDEDSNPLELSERPFALVGGAVSVADPKDLLDGSKRDGETVLERAIDVVIVDPTGWQEFVALAARDR